MEIGSIIGMIDYDMDAIDAITVEVGRFGVIDYKLDGLMQITIKIDHDVYGTVIKIILQIAGTYIILIMVVIPNVILISKLHTKRNIRCKFNDSKIIWFVLNRNQTIAVIVIHHVCEFDTSIRSMNYYHLFVFLGVLFCFFLSYSGVVETYYAKLIDFCDKE